MPLQTNSHSLVADNLTTDALRDLSLSSHVARCYHLKSFSSNMSNTNSGLSMQNRDKFITSTIYEMLEI